MSVEDEIKEGNRLTELVDVDWLTSFPQSPFTEGLDLDDVVVVWVEGQFYGCFGGDDGVHVVVSMSSVQDLWMVERHPHSR